MNKYLKYLMAGTPILATCLITLGFNTIEWMTQVKGQPETWYFIYHQSFLSMPFWYAYFFGGIVPLVSGGILLGFFAGWTLHGRRKKNVN